VTWKKEKIRNRSEEKRFIDGLWEQIKGEKSP
jgi:hypothetical protein